MLARDALRMRAVRTSASELMQSELPSTLVISCKRPLQRYTDTLDKHALSGAKTARLDDLDANKSIDDE
jgi:hypothetical protein